MIVHPNARKHGCSDAEIITAATHAQIRGPISTDDPPRQGRIGLDSQGQELELIVVFLQNGDVLVIHAMRCRPAFRSMLTRQR